MKENQIEITFLHERQRTLTESPLTLSNFFEPHSGHIGQARNPFN